MAQSLLTIKEAITYLKATYNVTINEIDLKREINSNALSILRQDGKINVLQEELDSLFAS